MHRTDHAEQFAQEGFTVFERVLDQGLLELLREECTQCMQREDARLDQLGTDVHGITHRGRRYFIGACQRTQPLLRQLLFSRPMAEICRATLGDTAYFFHDQFVVKGSDVGMPFGWHQDSGYVVGNGGPADHKPYLTCWCPLDDATLDNGTIRLHPFSKLPESRERILPHRRQAGSNDLVGWEGEDPGIALEIAAGSVVAFSSLLVHATGANQTSTLRRVYLAQYSAEVILNPGTRQLRRDAIPLLQQGAHVTVP
jgi:ectoine hydroxylase-related dioxygenase (phytanoyl-CoA dioxygenase family)